MTAFSQYAERRKSQLRKERADNLIGYASMLILGWLWLPSLLEMIFGG